MKDEDKKLNSVENVVLHEKFNYYHNGGCEIATIMITKRGYNQGYNLEISFSNPTDYERTIMWLKHTFTMHPIKDKHADPTIYGSAEEE